MEKIKQTLWKDYNDVSEQIDELNVGDEHYKLLLEEKDKIRNELIKLEEANMETKLKEGQIEADNNKEKIRNAITIGTFAITTGVSLYAIIKTFKFDTDSTVTSTLGRGILNGVVPKMFKK